MKINSVMKYRSLGYRGDSILEGLRKKCSKKVSYLAMFGMWDMGAVYL